MLRTQLQREGVYEGAVHPAHRGAVQVTDTSARSRRALLGAPLAGPPDLRGSEGPGARGGPRGCTARAGPAGGRRRRQPGQQRGAGPRLRQGAAPGRAGLCRAVQSCAEPCRAVPGRAEPGEVVGTAAGSFPPPAPVAAASGSPPRLPRPYLCSGLRSIGPAPR